MTEKTVSFITNFINQFKQFALRGNAVDLAIGVIIGSAFGKIVSALVQDLLMPFLGIFLGAIDLSNLTVTIGKSTISYGHFLQTLMDFIIIAFCIFLLIKALNIFMRGELGKKQITQKDILNAIREETRLLADIKELLAQQNLK